MTNSRGNQEKSFGKVKFRGQTLTAFWNAWKFEDDNRLIGYFFQNWLDGVNV